MKSLLNSFRYAGNGLRIALRSERNLKIHLAAFVAALVLGVHFEISIIEWAIVFLASSTVIVSELINTAIEKVVDQISLNRSPALGNIKDISAGAVLVAAFFAFICGAIIFVPRLLSLIKC